MEIYRDNQSGKKINGGDVTREISQEELKRVLDYNPKTGVFTWKIAPCGHGVKKGSVAGCLHPRGWRYIRYRYHGHAEHRLAFLYMTGSMPDFVDHKDRNRSNNSWSNLRESDPLSNSVNQGIRIDNKSGYKGVHFCKDRNKWRAGVRFKGVQIDLGRYDTAVEAAEAYNTQAFEMHGELAVLNEIKEIT